MLTFGSLFAGIGGIDLGLERAGMTCKWQVEINDYARAVLQKHWPDVPKFTDIKECGGHNLEPVDLICGGFPCQDVSAAGKKAGLKEGTRTGLWFEYARIIGELRPRWVLAENVPGLRSSNKGRGLAIVLRDLAALGYDAEWHSIPAAALGAPHRRDRVFIVAHAQSTIQHRISRDVARAGIAPIWESQQKRDELGRGGKEVAHAASKHGEWPVTERNHSGESEETARDGSCHIPDANSEPLGRPPESWPQCGQWAIEPDVGRVADGVPSRVDRLRCLGNAVVPQVAEFVGRMIVEAE